MQLYSFDFIKVHPIRVLKVNTSGHNLATGIKMKKQKAVLVCTLWRVVLVIYIIKQNMNMCSPVKLFVRDYSNQEIHSVKAPESFR